MLKVPCSIFKGRESDSGERLIYCWVTLPGSLDIQAEYRPSASVFEDLGMRLNNQLTFFRITFPTFNGLHWMQHQSCQITWHSNHWVGDSDATVGVGQSCTVHYREEEHATPLYKAWKPVPPGSVPGHPLLPHWDFQTVSLCPPHLPSLWSEGSQRLFCSSTVLSSSLSLLGREGRHIIPGLL